MANYSDVHDIGAKLKEGSLVTPRAISLSTAGTTVNGSIVDRRSVGGTLGILTHAAKILVPYAALSLTTGSTSKVTWQLEHSSSTATAGFSIYDDIDGTSVHTVALTGDGAETGVDAADFRLDTAKRYVRIAAEAINNSTAGTVNYAVTGVFGVGDEPPA